MGLGMYNGLLVTHYKVGRLQVLDKWKQDGRDYALTLCDCGNKKAMRYDYIQKCVKENLEASCGCRQKEHARDLGFKNKKFNYNRKKLHDCWDNMQSRCHDPKDKNYYRYGARGIYVCDRWRNSIEDFISDVGIPIHDKMQLDRINNDGNYEPGNVRWVECKENVRNRSNTRRVTYLGITKPLATWCEELNISYDMVKQRLNGLSWSVERALTEPGFLGKNQSYGGKK